MRRVDILLPIYNSYEETKNCIESILEHTSEGTYHLYLLDDRSPDPKIKELLSTYSEKFPDFIIAVRNEQNLGFPGNVNNGFKISKHDVVILNSDTLVSEGWLEKLNEVANKEESIAAVNPMSNYGIISGLPTANSEINDLFTFDEISKAFLKHCEPCYVETPILIGFCMYMKRRALDEVGHFDAETFKRGYGEESDWCMRARKMGLKLVVATESYVHHIGGVSFGEEKEKLISQSRKVLLERYPEKDAEVEKFVKGNHFKEIRGNIMKEIHFLRTKASFPLKLKMIKHYYTNTLK